MEPLAQGEKTSICAGDVVRSAYGRAVRAVLCVTDVDAVLRLPSGKVDSVPLDALSRFWYKVGTVDTYDMSSWSKEAVNGLALR